MDVVKPGVSGQPGLSNRDRPNDPKLRAQQSGSTNRAGNCPGGRYPEGGVTG